MVKVIQSIAFCSVLHFIGSDQTNETLIKIKTCYCQESIAV